MRLHLFVLFCMVIALASGHANNKTQGINHFELKFGKVILPISINGVQMRFLLDTGCGANGFIRESLTETHQIPIVPGKSAQSAGWGGTNKEWTTLNFYKVDKIQVGDSSFENVELLGRKDFWEYDVDGMICSGLLKNNQNILLDYGDESFQVTEKDLTLQKWVPFVFQNEREILVGVKIDGTDISNFNFDTGSHVVHISDEVSNKTGLRAIPGNDIEIGDAKGDTMKAKLVAAQAICLGELCVKDLELVSSGIHKYQKEFQRNGILGYPFFQGHRFIISFPKKVIYYE